MQPPDRMVHARVDEASPGNHAQHTSFVEFADKRTRLARVGNFQISFSRLASLRNASQDLEQLAKPTHTLGRYIVEGETQRTTTGQSEVNEIEQVDLRLRATGIQTANTG
jgi:hypothetical protein